MSIPIYPSSSLFPLGNYKFLFSTSMTLFCFINWSICTIFFDATFKQYHDIYICQTSLSMMTLDPSV